jgi:predicted Rossmann fold nucleotide-binding protein DprA/Smf involved in DNA uptake
MSASIHFGGSRALSPRFASQVASVVQASLCAGAAVRVGCAVGADQFVIQAALSQPQRLSIFAQFSATGAGAFSGSAVQPVLSAQAAGAQVSFLAGGPLQVPLRARLLRRSIAALRGSSAAVFFLASPSSAGSLNVAAQAAALSIPVFIFPLGFIGQPQNLRFLPGAWRPASFAGSPCLQWFAGPSFF